MKNIVNSFNLTGRGRIIELSFDFSERYWIQSVKYEVNTQDKIPYIVTTAGRSKLYKLQDNPEVISFGEDLFYIHSIRKDQNTAEDIDVDVLYQVDINSGNVFKVSHLFIHFEDEYKQVLYGESIETYKNIFSILQTKFPELVQGLFVKTDGVYKYFLDLELE